MAVELAETAEDGGGGGGPVYVAVGKSTKKAISLLRWTFQRFGSRDICLVHVHRPSPVIPTLLGKLPASQANGKVVSAFRREEKEQMGKLMSDYLNILSRTEELKASYIMIEADQVDRGIVELVNKHRIRMLVMGAVPGKRAKINKVADYAAKYSPPFCEIWFINRGKHLWTRVASACPTSLQPVIQPQCVLDHPPTLSDSEIQNLVHEKNVESEEILCQTTDSYFALSTEQAVCNDSCSNPKTLLPKTEEECLHALLEDPTCDDAALEVVAMTEYLRCGIFELVAVDAIEKAGALETARREESRLRKEVEDALRSTVQEEAKLLQEMEYGTRVLQKTMRSMALLQMHTEEAKCRCEEAAKELKVIEASISTLQYERQMIQQQEKAGRHWLEQWRSQGQARAAAKNCHDVVSGVVDDLKHLAEFSLSDLETATCNFSESFKIGLGGYGCVYKGEMLDRTVAIKKLHPHCLQGESEFQQEVQVLGKLKHHPHLVTLIGACPEAWSLVYEYMPSGSLQDRLSRKTAMACLSWKIRTRIIADISTALLFLHSSKPSSVVHGNLKPENILLNSDLRCKICDFGISRLVPEESPQCQRFCRYSEPTSAFPYTDPEVHRTGIPTPMSDMYAFGLIILQLLTGRPPMGLAIEVRRAVSCGDLRSVVDSSAGEWPVGVVKQLLDLGLRSCEPSSRNRLELRPSLVVELKQLVHASGEWPVPSFFLCPILQEIMHDPQIAEDGFTYEGEALRGWLANGREASPMTNLRLGHPRLTPNHAIRLAIQEWLCRA